MATQCLDKNAEINEFSASDEMLQVMRETGRQQTVPKSRAGRSKRLIADSNTSRQADVEKMFF